MLYGAGDNVAVTAAFITGATASTVEPELPPPEQSAGVSTSHWVTVISTDILVCTHTYMHAHTQREACMDVKIHAGLLSLKTHIHTCRLHAHTHAHYSQENFPPLFLPLPIFVTFFPFLLLYQFPNHTRDRFRFCVPYQNTQSLDKTYFGTLREVFKELKYSRGINGFTYIKWSRVQLSNEVGGGERWAGRAGWEDWGKRGEGKQNSREMEGQRLQGTGKRTKIYSDEVDERR